MNAVQIIPTHMFKDVEETMARKCISLDGDSFKLYSIRNGLQVLVRGKNGKPEYQECQFKDGSFYIVCIKTGFLCRIGSYFTDKKVDFKTHKLDTNGYTGVLDLR